MEKLTQFDFIVLPKDDLNCQVCKEVAAEPYQHGRCGKLFCSACLNRDRPCSHCGGSKGFFRDQKSKRNIDALLVKCRNSFGDHSCQWTGVYGDLVSHYQDCPFASIPCPNQCLDDGNAVKSICRISLHEHLESHCANREHTCPQCSEVMMFREYAAHERTCPARGYQCKHCNMVMNTSEHAAHDSTCPKKPVECPNMHLGCSSMVQRRGKKKHLQDNCIYAEVACKYARIGCNTRMPRRDIHTHERDNDALHFPMALTRVMELDARVTSNSRVTLCSGRNMPFKLSHYQRHKENQETFTSPEFSTPSGHSMAVKVQFSGGQISLSTKTIKSSTTTGAAEDPKAFDGNITICVLNQLKDDDHLSKSGVQNLTKFTIAYSRIESTNRAEVQYLKEDTLYCRVTYDTPKPWLECMDTTQL